MGDGNLGPYFTDSSDCDLDTRTAGFADVILSSGIIDFGNDTFGAGEELGSSSKGLDVCALCDDLDPNPAEDFWLHNCDRGASAD